MPIPKQNTDVEDIDNEDIEDTTSNDESGGEESTTNEDSAAPQLGEQEDGSVVVAIDDEDGGESDTTDSESTDEDEQERQRIREARRQERQERKQRAREREERVQRELAQEREARRQLEQRLATIERRNTGAEVAQLDNVIKQTNDAYGYFKSQIEEATARNDGKGIAEATEKMILARERLQQLNRVKQVHEQRQSAPAPLDERLVDHANKFMRTHTWYKPEGNDMDSQIMRNIDNAVAAEGWDPTTEAYWTELNARLKKYLPHRVARGKVQTNDGGKDEMDEQDDKPIRQSSSKPKSVVSGSGQGAGPSGGKTVFHLSPERTRAIKEAGLWDDPVQRQKAIKAYRDYDKANKGGK